MRMLGSIALAACLIAAPGLARDKEPPFVESKAVADGKAVTFNPAKAYLLLRSDSQQSLYLMKVPTPDDDARYAALHAEALAKAQRKYLKQRAAYDRAVADAAKLPKGTPRPQLPEPPVEPVDATFAFTPFGLMADVGIGPINRFAKDKGASTYLQEVTPGEYRVYGPLSVMPAGGAIGMCFCMGSVKFVARAGEIVDLGVILAADAAKAPDGDSSMPRVGAFSAFLTPAPADMPLDPRLAGTTVRRAEYRPVGKLPNYYGVEVGRIPEMPGVLHYERDRIVDLTAPGK